MDWDCRLEGIETSQTVAESWYLWHELKLLIYKLAQVRCPDLQNWSMYLLDPTYDTGVPHASQQEITLKVSLSHKGKAAALVSCCFRGLVMTSYYSCLHMYLQDGQYFFYVHDQPFFQPYILDSSKLIWSIATCLDLSIHSRNRSTSCYPTQTVTVRSLSRSIVTVVPIRTYGTMGLFIYFISFIYLFATRTQSYHGGGLRMVL